MAKTVKFNLICDGNPVRTVDDLRENFSIEDVLAYYNNRLLHRWLGVRGYTELLEKVEEISTNDSMEIIKSLIALFNVEVDIKKVEESVYILQYKQEREELFSIYQNNSTKTNAVIDDHQAGYTQLVDTIIDNAKDIAKIRAAVTEMIGNYYWILEKDHRNLFYKLYYKAPMALFVMLTHDETRKFYLPQMIIETATKEDGTEEVIEKTTDVAKKYDDDEMTQLMTVKLEMYKRICGLISTVEITLGDNLLTFSGDTQKYFKPIQSKGKNYMIIEMQPGNFVRPLGNDHVQLGYEDVHHKFIILDGIDYESNNANHKLLYMEV